MKLAEKISELRRANGMTQEELAYACNVTRQSISKWEADIASPELEKLLLLGELFHVSMDVLLKDELTVSAVKKVHCCGSNAVHERKQEVFEGVLIKESIEDEEILDDLNIHKLELWKTGGNPRYWTVLLFSANCPDFPERLSGALKSDPAPGENWFADFRAGNEKYIVFRNKVLHYQIGNAAQKQAVCDQCRSMGITDDQMNWSE
ncbi:MAG: helix-turn-helix domain-containing protein [Faecousia sp.]